MSTQLRFGICIEPSDAFWVQIREEIFRRGKEEGLEILPIYSGGYPLNPSPDQQRSFFEELISQELDVLFGWTYPEQMAYPLLESGLAIVHLSETDIKHPLSVSPLDR